MNASKFERSDIREFSVALLVLTSSMDANTKVVLRGLAAGLTASAVLRRHGYQSVFHGDGIAVQRSGHVLGIVNWTGSEFTLFRAASAEPIARTKTAEEMVPLVEEQVKTE